MTQAATVLYAWNASGDGRQMAAQQNNNLNVLNELDNSQQCSTVLNESQQSSTSSQRNQQGNGSRFEGNLTAEIREWLKDSTGSFTVADIDREFGLTTRQDKQRRSTALKEIKNKNYIIRDRRVAGRWHIVNTELNFIDLEAEDESPFKLSLPLDLSQIVTIPPKSIIVLAGSPNSGKTCLALNTLRANMGEHRLLYLMSEMGGSEYKQRVLAFGDDLGLWKEYVKAAPLSSGFDGAIKHHNPNGITIIDFLEEIEGEYYRISSDIRAIYDSLGDGVAIICLQKKSNALFGRGGEATTEKARLYVTLDTLSHQPGSTIASLRIGKAKSYPGSNPNNKERHFRIIRGHQIKPLSSWMYCHEQDRAAWVTKYQHDEQGQ